jgi:hypothetical protein
MLNIYCPPMSLFDVSTICSTARLRNKLPHGRTLQTNILDHPPKRFASGSADASTGQPQSEDRIAFESSGINSSAPERILLHEPASPSKRSKADKNRITTKVGSTIFGHLSKQLYHRFFRTTRNSEVPYFISFVEV